MAVNHTTNAAGGKTKHRAVRDVLVAGVLEVFFVFGGRPDGPVRSDSQYMADCSIDV